MPSAENAQWDVEIGQTANDMAALTDSGDHKLYKGSKGLWSSAKGKAATVLVNGIRNGFSITPKSGTTNAVTVASGQANLNGVVEDIAGADVTGLTRPPGTAGANFIKHSIILNAAKAIAIAAGTSHTAWSNVRGDPGGPPLIAVDAVELGQVWFASATAADVLDTDIQQLPGETQERADTPLYKQDNYKGTIEFYGPLPLIHTGAVPKKAFAKFYEPQFAEIVNANNMQPPAISKSANSTPVYKSSIGSVANSLQAGSVTVLVDNGVNDLIIKSQDWGLLWHRFHPDANASPYHIGQAHVGIVTTYPADNNISTTVALVPETAWQRVD